MITKNPMLLAGLMAAMMQVFFPGPGQAQSPSFVWPEYEATRAEIARLSKVLTDKNREVVARFARNDTPEALAVLGPIRAELRRAEDTEERLLCRDGPPIGDTGALFARLRIRVDRGRVDHGSSMPMLMAGSGRVG